MFSGREADLLLLPALPFLDGTSPRRMNLGPSRSLKVSFSSESSIVDPEATVLSEPLLRNCTEYLLLTCDMVTGLTSTDLRGTLSGGKSSPLPEDESLPRL